MVRENDRLGEKGSGGLEERRTRQPWERRLVVRRER